jgi:hypothetical protein
MRGVVMYKAGDVRVEDREDPKIVAPTDTPGQPDASMIASLLAASDVLGTGWFAAVAAEVQTRKGAADLELDERKP